MTKIMTRLSARRVLAAIMAFMLALSIIVPNMTAWADSSATTTNGYYDVSGEWHEGGDGVFTYNNGDLVLSKKANAVNGQENVFEITLSVGVKLDADMFNPNSIATVLVLDVSGSMRACDICGSQTSHYSDCVHYDDAWLLADNSVKSNQTRLYAAKQAAIAFLDEMRKEAPEGVGRYVHLVKFSNDASKMLTDWQDVTTDEGYETAKAAINALSATGGTNLDAGLGLATELMSDEQVSSISKAGKNVVVLTDGQPTYYIDTNGTTKGNGSDSTQVMLEDTTAAATELKKIANIFTICYSASTTNTYSGGPTVGEFLEESIASPAEGDLIFAYTADSAVDLIDSFMSVVDVSLEKSEVVITDPLPDNIIMPEGSNPDGVSYIDGYWSFQDVIPTEERVGDYIIYTYKIIYKVEIDPYANGLEPGKFYPANKPTQLILEDGTTYDFPVPGVMPLVETFDVTYNSGDHGSIDGEDEDGNVTFNDIVKGNETPKPPAVTPDDGWYFVGWSPEITDKVGNEIVYTAIYSQKTVITATGNSGTLTYNGQEQSLAGFSVDGLPAGWSVTGLGYSNAGTNAGTYTGAFEGTVVILDENQNIVPDEQYVLVMNPGTLTIAQRDLTITADSDEKVYDGTALTDAGWTASGLAGDDEIVSVTVIGSQTNVGTSANVASGAVITRNRVDVTANYNIIYVDGTLIVTKNAKVITITAASDSKVYDGTPLTNYGYTYTSGVIAEGDYLVVTIKGSQTDAGTSVNEIISYSVMRGGVNVTDYYTIETVNGTLTVEKRDLTITADSANKVYDGTVLKDNGWKDTAPAGLADGDTVASVTVEGGQFGVGSSANVASGAIITRGGVDVTANYDITYVDGTLTVEKIGTSITITANSNSKIYDGLPLEDGGFTFTQGVLAEGDVLLVEVVGDRTDVGVGVNEVVSYKVMRDGVDVTDYYTIETVDGTLTVEKRNLTITANSATQEYDGTSLSDIGWTADGLASTDVVENVIVEGGQVGVGVGANVASDAIITRGGVDATDNYNITYVDGTLTVTKNTQTITITADSDSKEYDGTPLTNDGYTFTSGILAEGDILTVTVMGSQTYVGTSANKVVSYKVMRDGVDITDYYTFEAVDGTLTVEKVSTEIIVEAGSDSKEYDGTPLTSDEYTFNSSVLAYGDELVVVIEGSQTQVGTSANKVVSVKVMRDGFDVTDNYTIGVSIDGELTVTKVSNTITIEANSASKEYDGTPLTDNGFTFTDGILADGDEIVAVVEGSQTVAGISENKVVSYKVIRDGVDVTDAYTIDTEVGFLEVTAKSDVITITADSDSKIYDGTPLTNAGFTFTEGILIDGDVITAVVEGDRTDVGTGFNEVISVKVMRGDVDVTGCYTFSTERGTLTIEKRALTITADSASKIYDGTTLTDEGWKDTAPAGLASGDEIVSVYVVGGQNEVGQSANVASSALIMRDGVEVTYNYDITYVDGTLTVLKVGSPITITANSDTKEYDGTPLTNDGYTFTQGVLAAGDELVVVIEGSQTAIGSSANKVVSYKVMRDGVDVTDFYTFAPVVDGTLTVTKISTEIIVTGNSDSKVYDGTPLTNNGFTFTEGVLVEGDEIVAVIEGSQTFVGSSANKVVSVKVMRGDVDVTDHYTIGTSISGTLTIEKVDEEIIVTGNSDSKVYDGTPLTNNGFTFTEGVLAEGDEIVAVIEGSQTFAGSSANKVVSVKVMRGEIDVTDNYTIGTAIDGVLTVEKIETPIVITAGSSDKPYDGTPLTNGEYTFTPDVLVDGDELIVEIEGSQTEIGSSENKVVSVRVVRGEIDVTDCYEITLPVDGTLTITEPIPETGDNSNVAFWNVMMVISLFSLLFLAFTSRKKKERA
ncbi:MAG: VWA domain-containing protein [Clostridia bacterium]|nr:VWA domain-containing protein [Clostridia bacterium]